MIKQNPNRQLLAVIITLLLNSTMHAFSSQTFFMPRSIGSDLTLSHAGSYNFIHKNEPAERYFSSLTCFYQNSTNSKELSKYFFPSGKTELLIKGALAPNTPTSPAADISATWLRITGTVPNPTSDAFPAGTNFVAGDEIGTPGPAGTGPQLTKQENIALFVNAFESKIKISPEYKSFGSVIQFYKNLGFITDRLWVSAILPFIQVETNTKLNEFNKKNFVDSRDETQTFLIEANNIERKEPPSLEQMINATEAFNNPQWKYGKITNSVQQLAGLADINLKLGYQLYKKGSSEFSFYGSLVIPTGYKPTAKYLFEPVLGNGNFWALGTGLSLNTNFCNRGNLHAQFSSNLDFQYLLSNIQKRSFDLINNGEWSRYLLVSTPNILANIASGGLDFLNDNLQPGINFFTQNVKVDPKYEINWINALNFSYKKMVFEFGHNIWIKSKEKLTLRDAFPENTIALVTTDFGVIDAAKALDHAKSFSKATIDQSVTDYAKQDNSLKFLSRADLDLDSGTTPFRLSNKFHLIAGINGSWKKYPLHAHIGASYELSHANSSLDSWMVWLKISTSI